MELKEAMEILERHNKWRRGAEIPQESPGELGIAIDTVLEAVMGKDEMDALDGFARYRTEEEERLFRERIESDAELWGRVGAKPPKLDR